MAPAYPHPTPNMNLNVIDHPTGASISGMPNLGALVGNVATWMQDNGTTGNSWVPITQPGAVLVVANAVTDNPYGGMARAEVLNGSMQHTEVSRLHQQWEQSNAAALKVHRSPKMQGADPKYAYATNELLEQVALPPALGGSCNAYTDKIGKKIYINAHVDDGSIVIHEYFHTFDPGDPSDIGWGFDEGIVDFFARDVSAKFQYKYLGNGGYEGGYQTVKAIVDVIGLEKICQFWFERPAGIFGPLSEKSKAIAEFCKPGEAANVSADLIRDFCETAMSLRGWKASVVAPVAASKVAKKWPTVKSTAGAFRSHN